jgi:hypothetical protein
LGIWRSDHGHILGLYSTIPWQSEGGWQRNTGKVIAFRLESDTKLCKVSKAENAEQGVYFAQTHMCWAYRFGVYDKAHQNNTSWADTSAENWQKQPSLSIDNSTYWAGAQRPKVTQMEVF